MSAQAVFAGISLDWDANPRADLTQGAWEAGVKLQLSNLLMVPPYISSRSLYWQMLLSGRRTVIQPCDPPSGGVGQSGAAPKDMTAATPPGLLAVGKCAAPTPQAGNPVGTGVGSDAIVLFTSQDYIATVGKPGGHPDEVLLHEMAHALRYTRGQRICTTLPDQTGQSYDKIEELFAIIISNIYHSENGRTALRQDHHGKNPLQAPLTDDKEFFKKWRTQITGFRNEMPTLCIHLAAVPCKFNPIRVAMREIMSAEAINVLHTDFIADESRSYAASMAPAH